MSLLESLDALCDVAALSRSVQADAENAILFSFEQREPAQRRLERDHVPHDLVGADQISVSLHSIRGIFYDRADFLKRCTSLRDLNQSDFGILFFENQQPLFYDSRDCQTFIAHQPAPGNRFIQNTLFYLEFLKEFKRSELCAYSDDARREFVLISPDKGKLQAGYPLIPPEIPNDLGVKEHFQLFCNRNQSPEFNLFLREQLIESLAAYNREERFPQLVFNIQNFLEASQRNYETYLNKFDFEELKKNFRKERDEYFSSIRGILSKILEKVVSIPISISAAALAIYNLKSETNYATIVIVAFILYSLFECYLLKLLKLDVKEIRLGLDSDLEIIKTSSNIPPKILEEEGAKIYRKIDKANSSVLIIQALFTVLSCAVLFVSFEFLSWPTGYREIAVLLVLLFHAYISSAKT